MSNAMNFTGTKGTEVGEPRAQAASSELREQVATDMLAVLPRVIRTIKHIARGAEDDKHFNEMGQSQMMALHSLMMGKQLTSELARRFNVTNPTMTRIVDALVEKGYVRRQHDSSDRRCIYLELTESGMEMGKYAHRQGRAALAQFMRPLSEKQLRDIKHALSHLESLLPEDVLHQTVCPAQPSESARLD